MVRVIMARSRPQKRRPGGGGIPEARANRHAGPPGAGIARLLEDDFFPLIEETPDILLLILDGVQDPHNLGACLRTADGAGVTALIICAMTRQPVGEKS